MTAFNPYNEYLNVQCTTADQGSLILMTYDCAIRFCRLAKRCVENDDKEGKGNWLMQAFEAVSELRKSLRPGPSEEVANHLDKAYDFICRQITKANVLSDEEALDNAVIMLERLQETWKEIIQMQRKSHSVNAAI